MKEYKFEKDVWVIVKGENPHAAFLAAGNSLTTINEVEIFEDENLWKSKKTKMKIVDAEPTFSTDAGMKKAAELKDKTERPKRIAR